MRPRPGGVRGRRPHVEIRFIFPRSAGRWGEPGEALPGIAQLGRCDLFEDADLAGPPPHPRAQRAAPGLPPRGRHRYFKSQIAGAPRRGRQVACGEQGLGTGRYHPCRVFLWPRAPVPLPGQPRRQAGGLPGRRGAPATASSLRPGPSLRGPLQSGGGSLLSGLLARGHHPWGQGYLEGRAGVPAGFCPPSSSAVSEMALFPQFC